jgi:hypothetical protein
MLRSASMAHRRAFAVVLFVGASSSSCNMSKPGGIAIPKKQEAIENSQGNGVAPANRLGIDGLIPEGQSLMNATFHVTAGAGNLNLCSGNITLKLNAAILQSNSTKLFEFPAASLNCALIGKLDLTALLAGFSTSANPEMEVIDDVIHVKRLGKGSYDPSRPFIPSFIAASRSKLDSLNYSRDITLNDEEKKVSDKGTVTIASRGYPVSYKPPKMKREFNKVMDFDVRITGFNGKIDKPMHMIFDFIRFRMSLDPIAILSLDMRGSLKSLADSGRNNPALKNTSIGQLMGIIPDPNAPNTTALGRLVGGIANLFMQIIKVDLKMTLVSQDGLKDSVEAAEEDEEIFGDVDRKSKDEDE